MDYRRQPLTPPNRGPKVPGNTREGLVKPAALHSQNDHHRPPRSSRLESNIPTPCIEPPFYSRERKEHPTVNHAKVGATFDPRPQNRSVSNATHPSQSDLHSADHRHENSEVRVERVTDLIEKQVRFGFGPLSRPDVQPRVKALLDGVHEDSPPQSFGDALVTFTSSAMNTLPGVAFTELLAGRGVQGGDRPFPVGSLATPGEGGGFPHSRQPTEISLRIVFPGLKLANVSVTVRSNGKVLSTQRVAIEIAKKVWGCIEAAQNNATTTTFANPHTTNSKYFQLPSIRLVSLRRSATGDWMVELAWMGG